MKCGVFARLFYDQPYCNYFIEYYLNLGFDKIFLLQIDDGKYEIPSRFSDKVVIQRVQDDEANHAFIKQSEMEWMLFIDSDEFLMLNKKFKNIKDFVVQKTSEHDNVSCFYFRWANIEKYDNFNNAKNINELLNNYHLFKHRSIKSMVKVDDIVRLPEIIQHTVALKPQVNVYFESLYFKDEFHGDQVAIVQEGIPKVSDFSYNECYLLHLHTRSLRSLIIKSLQATFETKRVRQLAPVLDLLRNDHEFEDTKFLHEFQIRAFPKSALPYAHSEIGNVNKQLLNHRLYTSNYSLIDFKKEEAILLEVLKSVNVSFSDFVKFENRLVKIVFGQKTFHLPNIQNKS